MIKTFHFVFHILAYDIAWFACIWFASTKFAYVGPFVVAILLLLQYIWQHNIIKHTRGLSLFIMLFWFTGLLGDTFIGYIGAITFPETAYAYLPWGFPISPLFMQALWLSFGMMFYATLSVLMTRYYTSAILAFIGFPLAYYAGAILNAAVLTNLWQDLLTIGIVYSVLLPCILVIYQKIGPKP